MTFQAALLLGFVFIVTERVKDAAGPGWPKWATLLVALALGIGSVFLVGESDWAEEQVIGGLTLDSLNEYSKVIAGVFVGIGGALIDKGLNTVASIGENQPKPPTD